MDKRFLYMPKSDRRVLAVVLVGLVLVAGTVCLMNVDKDDTNAVTAADTINVPSPPPRHSTTSTHYLSGQHLQKPERFTFDPNTADSTQLLRLGLMPWQVRNIYKYRAAGGVFHRPRDFAKLYGLTKKQYRELEPFIRIAAEYRPAATLVDDRQPHARDTLRFPVKIREGEHVVLNTADTTALRRVPGIGSYYANKIIMYARRLGGYVSVDQLDEIDRFPAEAKKFFVIENPSPLKLNVNSLSLDELKRHPYINFYQAKAITDYRRLHGPIKSLHELQLLKEFTPEAIERLTPYVEF